MPNFQSTGETEYLKVFHACSLSKLLFLRKTEILNLIRKSIVFGEKGISWVHSKTSEKQFLIFSSFLVGITAGLAAIALKLFVFFIRKIVVYPYRLPFNLNSYLYLVFPMAGIILTVFITRRFFNKKLGRGTANIIRSIFKKSAVLPKDQMYSHIVTSGVTVGFGGSAGLESPIVTTGSAIGSNFAKTYKLVYKDRVLLLACGAAAGIAAAFNAPIAGVLFALEVLLVGTTIPAFIPLIISASMGALCSKIILNEEILLSFIVHENFNYHNFPFYVLLGVFTGLISIYYARFYGKVDKLFLNTPKTTYKRAIIGGLCLAFLIFLMPPLFGEGYESIKSLTGNHPAELLNTSVFDFMKEQSWFVYLFIAAVMLLKVVATAVTIGGGGNGGSFAPSLFIGAYLGFIFSKLINYLGITQLPINNFTLVGMAGVLTGIFHAPLTGVFLIAEITGGYELMIPLMMVSAISYIVVKKIEPVSMDEKILAKKGNIHRNNTDSTILSTLKVSKIIEKEVEIIHPDLSLKQLLDVVSHSKQTIFPVLSHDKQLLGVIYFDDLREIMFKTELYDQLTAKEIMTVCKTTIESTDSVKEIMKKFDNSKLWVLPVIQNGVFAGFIAKSQLLQKYRDELIRTTLRD